MKNHRFRLSILTTFSSSFHPPRPPHKILEIPKKKEVFCKFRKFLPDLSKFFSKPLVSFKETQQTPTFPFRVYKYYIPLNGTAGNLLGFARCLAEVCTMKSSRFANFLKNLRNLRAENPKKWGSSKSC